LGLSASEAETLESVLLSRLAEDRADDPVAALVDRQVDYLARALANTVNVFNPRMIVLGGFLGSLYAAAPERLTSAVRAHAMIGPRDAVEIVHATLGSSILTVGAAEIAFASLIADPAGSAAPDVAPIASASV
jgi:predicted NBD/HSP70 family sugar kinase